MRADWPNLGALAPADVDTLTQGKPIVTSALTLAEHGQQANGRTKQMRIIDRVSLQSVMVMLFAVIALSRVSLTYASDPRNWDPDKLANWVDRRVRQLQPTGNERRIDEIGWAKTILEAEQLAQEHKRPIFLFTYAGNIDTGRC